MHALSSPSLVVLKGERVGRAGLFDVGDIHQPLHVGAQYFDQSGHKVNPDLGKPVLEDQGGNSISLEVSGGPPEKQYKFTAFGTGSR